jgi:hypothetical protein
MTCQAVAPALQQKKVPCHRRRGELATCTSDEIKRPKWLANPIPVMKKNKTWRTYIDYTNLNNTCQKEEFGLPRIDQIIDFDRRVRVALLP